MSDASRLCLSSEASTPDRTRICAASLISSGRWACAISVAISDGQTSTNATGVLSGASARKLPAGETAFGAGFDGAAFGEVCVGAGQPFARQMGKVLGRERVAPEGANAAELRVDVGDHLAAVVVVRLVFDAGRKPVPKRQSACLHRIPQR